MAQTQDTQVYSKIRLTLDLAPANTLIKEAITNMVVNHNESWNALIYGQLLAGDPKRTQAFLVGSNEDMIMALLLTANYIQVPTSDNYALFVTDDFGIGSGVAPITKCSNDSIFMVNIEDDDKYSCRMLEGTCYPYPDYQVAIGLKKDNNNKWIFDMIVSNNWAKDDAIHPRLTLKKLDVFESYMKVNDIDPATAKTHLFSKADLLAMGIQNVDVHKVGTSSK